MLLLARLSRLVFVAASLLWLVGDGHAKEASLIAYCQSVNLSKGTASVAGTLLDAYFTTFDGSAGLPLYDTLGNFLVVSGELSPNPAAAGNHRTDYLLFANGVPNATGTASVNFPTTDADGNGVADFLQIAQAGSVAFNGTVTRQTPTAAPAQAMTGQISRAAGSSTGSYVAYLQDPVAGTVTYRGTSYLLNAQGGLTYDRTSNTAVITVKVSNEDGTTTTYSGGGKFVVVDANTVSFPAITYSGSNARVLQAKPFTLTRSGRRYLGNTEFQDGGLSTTWRDYIQWRTEITDNNDVDANGIPDFSDNVLVAPSITAQPQPVTVTVGQAVQFSVTATGTAPLSYQWQRNTQNISGATGATYAIASAQLANAGDYQVLVSNPAGNVTSQVAKLTVNIPVVAPGIATQPQPVTVTVGQSVQFSVTATGTAPLSYQWQRNTQNISGATGATYAIASAQLADAGDFSVVVSNAAGDVTSQVAKLTVQPLTDDTLQSGTVVAWGQNTDGQTTVPVGLRGVTAIAAGNDHTAAVKSDGTVVAWGRNASGQTTVPVGLRGVTAIAAGYEHTVALKSDGNVVAWGRNGEGQTTVPAGLSGVTAIVAGGYHTVALKSDGTVVAWGDNRFGQTTVPAGLSGVAAIAAGVAHTVALKRDGTVVAWGRNEFGLTIVPAGLNRVTTIAAGGYHTVALQSDGTLVAWGYNEDGRTTVPAGLSGVMAMAVGGAHTVALLSAPPFAPEVTIRVGRVGVVTLDLKVVLGRKYQLQASQNLKVWTVTGPDFVAQTESLTQELVVAEAVAFFRVVEVP